MRLLVDTHVLIWWLAEPERLSARTIALLRGEDADVRVSVGSVWEIAIKRAMGKLRLPIALTDALSGSIFQELPITAAHAEHAGELPPHHADPFDRVLIAQAQLEGLTIVTADRHFGAYGVPVITP